jgi:hypothetical protein
MAEFYDAIVVLLCLSLCAFRPNRFALFLQKMTATYPLATWLPCPAEWGHGSKANKEPGASIQLDKVARGLGMPKGMEADLTLDLLERSTCVFLWEALVGSLNPICKGEASIHTLVSQQGPSRPVPFRYMISNPQVPEPEPFERREAFRSKSGRPLVLGRSGESQASRRNVPKPHASHQRGNQESEDPPQ